MIPKIDNWKPMEVRDIQKHLGAFTNWCLCGGQSLDWLVGRNTRKHGDTDIGVFRSEIHQCLEQIGGKRVFLCDPPGSLVPWDGGKVPDSVHDIWISDANGQAWVLQVMIYDEDGEDIVYRRDSRIRWPKRNHSVLLSGIQIVNPVVTLLFKLNKSKLEAKDCQDIEVLITEVANRVAGSD